jgi:hypothetical protein
MKYVKPKMLNMKLHPELDEKWVQKLIQDDPSILGLGDLVMLQAERIQPSGGRLDLLLQDRETKRRYEVELQLGATDETHIVRTIEYWDVERKRYPQYDHCAVIIAEDVTGRFLNVISLFNGAIPLVAIRVQALEVGDQTTLVFTTVLDELRRGVVDEDEAAEAAPADRAYWEQRAKPATVATADKLFAIAREIDPAVELKYNKFYIGLQKDGRAINFVTFTPQKAHVVMEVKLRESPDIDKVIAEAGLDALSYDNRWNCYRLRLKDSDVTKPALKVLVELAHQQRMA